MQLSFFEGGYMKYNDSAVKLNFILTTEKKEVYSPLPTPWQTALAKNFLFSTEELHRFERDAWLCSQDRAAACAPPMHSTPKRLLLDSRSALFMQLSFFSVVSMKFSFTAESLYLLQGLVCRCQVTRVWALW